MIHSHSQREGKTTKSIENTKSFPRKHQWLHNTLTAALWNFIFIQLILFAFIAQGRPINDNLCNHSIMLGIFIGISLILSLRLAEKFYPNNWKGKTGNQNRIRISYIASVTCIPAYLIECTKGIDASDTPSIIVLSFLAATAACLNLYPLTNLQHKAEKPLQRSSMKTGIAATMAGCTILATYLAFHHGKDLSNPFVLTCLALSFMSDCFLAGYLSCKLFLCGRVSYRKKHPELHEQLADRIYLYTRLSNLLRTLSTAALYCLPFLFSYPTGSGNAWITAACLLALSAALYIPHHLLKRKSMRLLEASQSA